MRVCSTVSSTLSWTLWPVTANREFHFWRSRSADRYLSHFEFYSLGANHLSLLWLLIVNRHYRTVRLWLHSQGWLLCSYHSKVLTSCISLHITHRFDTIGRSLHRKFQFWQLPVPGTDETVNVGSNCPTLSLTPLRTNLLRVTHCGSLLVEVQDITRPQA